MTEELRKAPSRPAPRSSVRPSETPPPAAGAAPESSDPLIGVVLLDRVRIVRLIARGGMGKVYYGEQTPMNRPCAVKVLDPRAMAGSDVADFTRRFLLEASVASKLTHPNVVTIFDYGETADGRCFIAMEYLEGRSLSEELRLVGKLEPERATHVVRQVCRALREAHALGVVHRDIKPGNVFLAQGDDDDDFVKVLDFGLVKDTSAPGEGAEQHTQVGRIMGSPRYMAPEQVQGNSVDARTDVYAIGAVFYAMLAGRPPFERANDLSTMMSHVSDPVPSIASVAPDVVLPPGIEAIVMRCLAKNPADRFASMDELIAALKLRPGLTISTASDSGAIASPLFSPPIVERPVPPRGNTGTIVAVLGVAAAALGIALFARGQASPVAPAPRETAPPAAPLPAPRATASLHVETDPPGARIREDGETVCAATPCDVVYTGDGADARVEHLLEIAKPDYKLEKRIVSVGASPLRVKLTRAR